MTSRGVFEIGTVYRYARPYDPRAAVSDGLPNYFHHVQSPGHKLPLLERGINPIAAVPAADGLRVPAILISSSPHKIGSEHTPWQDTFDVDNGFVRYFGDTKNRGVDPARSPGNAALIAQFRLHSSPELETRKGAAPLVFFERVTYKGQPKGHVVFRGFGIITTAELVTQYNPSSRHYFSNYVFEFAVFKMTEEHERFDWRWLSVRRDKSMLTDATERFAPATWQRWIAGGPALVERCRRNVASLQLVKTSLQRPPTGSREASALNDIYKFYANRKARFELLASRVTASILKGQGTQYAEGWITPASSDHGADFVGRIDLGTGFSRTKLVLLGQAKCEKLDAPTGGNHIARTVARLKRGWVGAYVTTSYFSEPVQAEVIEDQYPILLVHGLSLAIEVLKLSAMAGCASVDEFLEQLDSGYAEALHHRRPEEILID